MARASWQETLKRAFPFLKQILAIKDIAVVIFVLAIMAIIIVPLPSWLLDLLLTISLSLATLIILISIFIARPTDFSTYPTLILLVTLYRLALNIATTRMILSEGHKGPEAVSDIIASFGNFVVGGNYVIGIIVFTILVLVNYLVITNGSTRVAEVAARFSLDAMPGKQMAIDADLSAGLIGEEEARKRRAEIVGEANFYGAMDGASKFVKGDAIAGIIITIVNIVGGILIGTFQQDLSVSESAAIYTILTIGDGLVGQIPALLVSTATGIIITRASKDDANFAEGAIVQLGRDYKVMMMVGAILFLFAIVPGLPTVSLGFVALCFIVMALLVRDSQDGAIGNWLREKFPFLRGISGETAIKPKGAAAARKAGDPTAQPPPKPREKSPEEREKEEEAALDSVLKVELLELDLGYQLIKLADEKQGGDLSDRIRTMRRKIAADYGFLMPKVYIIDNLQLDPNTYQIKLRGAVIGMAQVFPNQFLAMNSGLAIGEIGGTPTKEPSFGLDAAWILASRKQDAVAKGYTVVDPSTVITTHLAELVKRHAEEMLTRQDVQKLIDSLKKDYPAVVDDALKTASLGRVQAVLKHLLHEKIPIRDMLTIMETIADYGGALGAESLTEQVRAALSRTITALFKSEQNGREVLRIVTIEQASEQRLLDKLKDRNGVNDLMLNVRDLNNIAEAARSKRDELAERGFMPMVLVVEPKLRRSLSTVFERFGLDIVVLSHAEIDNSITFEHLGAVMIGE